MRGNPYYLRVPHQQKQNPMLDQMTSADKAISASAGLPKLDLTEVIKKHQITERGKKLLYVPLKGSASSQLLIVMSTHNQGSNYLAMRTFLEDQKYDLLFVTDPSNTWYLDGDYGETFGEIFKIYTEKYKPENVFFFGLSMSGYGAILHALRLNANAIAANPQISLDMTREHSWPELREHITDLAGRHINIDEVADDLWQDSVVYIVHGHFEMDVLNVNLLSNARVSSKKLIVQTLDIDNHSFPFGREIENIYDVVTLATLYRNIVNVGHIEQKFLERDGALFNQRRKELQKNSKQDPMRSFDADGQVLWQLRHQYETPGRVVFFSNIGHYSNDRLCGAHCIFDGRRWSLVSPSLSISDNLIAPDSTIIDGTVVNPKNDQFINTNWKVRTHETAEMKISGSLNYLDIDLQKIETNNIFLNLSILPDAKTCSEISGKYLTLSADVYTSNGDAVFSLGGFGNSGYHHTNSAKAQANKWSSLTVMEAFPSIVDEHRDRLFVRINVGIDTQPKRVRVANLRLVLGYFPMGFS